MSKKRNKGKFQLFKPRQQKPNQEITEDRDMRLNRQKQVIETDESIPGLLDCSYEYAIKETTASMAWKGPKIPQELWYQITSFFKWTYDTSKSESQVRLYVSPTLGTWKAWAFPQEANTGMSACEVANEDAQRQRQDLGLNPPDWFLFGTVHHHCSMGAFQSGTDRENEESQDGLHITVGNMDKLQYDIHARFYRKTMKFETTLDLSLFFDIGDVLNTWPEVFSDYKPKNLENSTAKKLMGKPVAVEFPPEWKTNLIVKPTPPPVPQRQISIPTSTGADFYSSEIIPLWKRGQNAWREITAKAIARDLEAKDILDAVQDLGMEGFAYNLILSACVRHKVDVDDLIRQQPMNVEQDMAELQAKIEFEREQEDKNPKSGNSNGAGAPGNYDSQWAYLHNIT